MSEARTKVPVHLTRLLVYQKLKLLNFEPDQCRNSPRKDAYLFPALVSKPIVTMTLVQHYTVLYTIINII